MPIQIITRKSITTTLKDAERTGAVKYVWDSDLTGFGVRISPKGKVTWLVQKSVGTRGSRNHIRVVVGHLPSMSLEDARLRVGQTILDIANGIDVQSAKRERKSGLQERLNSITLRTAFDEYLADRAGNRRRSKSERYANEIRQKFEHSVIPRLGASTRIALITKADIRDILKAHKDAGHYVAARNLFAQLRPFFNWCVHEEYLAVSPCVGVVPPAAPPEREHKLNSVEIVALWSVADSVPVIGPYYRLLLLTAQRRTELAGMRWHEVNLDKAEWTIPGNRTKNGREHLVPLSTQAIAILQSFPRCSGDADYVFGRWNRSPLSGFGKAKREFDDDMQSLLGMDGLRHWRLHDLRRTAASGMKALRVFPHVIEAILNHTPSKLQRTYQLWDLHEYAEDKRDALERWGQFVLSTIPIYNTETQNRCLDHE